MIAQLLGNVYIPDKSIIAKTDKKQKAGLILIHTSLNKRWSKSRKKKEVQNCVKAGPRSFIEKLTAQGKIWLSLIWDRPGDRVTQYQTDLYSPPIRQICIEIFIYICVVWSKYEGSLLYLFHFGLTHNTVAALFTIVLNIADIVFHQNMKSPAFTFSVNLYLINDPPSFHFGT